MKRLGCAVLAAAFLAVACSGCGSRFEQPYNAEEAVSRMSSGAAVSARAKSFAADLVVPGTKDFNADEIGAKACLLVPLEGGVDAEALAYKNPYEKAYPASITKVMTALVALENVKDLSQVVTVSENARITEPGASLAHIKPGDQLTIEQLLYGLLVPSGNDAGVAIAEAVAGSEEAFVQMMNEEAVKVGATGTHFMNSHGLHDDDHYTTPYDIYLIYNAALKYPEFETIAGTKNYAAKYKNKDGDTVSQVWQGSNLFVTGERKMPEGLTAVAGKTGTTKKAGSCLVLEEQKDDTGKKYLSIIMNAESKTDLYDQMYELTEKIR